MATKQQKRKRRFIIWGILALVAVFFIVAKLAGWIGAEEILKVQSEKPTERIITELITANGKVQPEIEVKIAPEVSGEIVELAVKEGDYVQKGQLLIRIKPDTYASIKERTEAQLSASKAQLSQIEAQLNLAKQTYDRQKGLFSEKAIAQADFETAEGQYYQLLAQKKASQANISAAEAQLKQSTEDLFKTTIYAPSSGTVSKLSVELGERVVGTATMAGTEMLRLADLSKMEVRAEVNENDIVRVEMGDSAKIEIDAYQGRKFNGVVTRIANSSISTTSSADQVTSYEVRIQIVPDSYTDLVVSGEPSPFRPSMSSTVDIYTNTKRALAIPIKAVTSRTAPNGDKEVVVFTLTAGNTAKKQIVTTGIQDKNFIEITGGLDSTVVVITDPFSAVSKTLFDGMKVASEAPKAASAKADSTATTKQ